jgi:small subunit ribosomal protein S20
MPNHKSAKKRARQNPVRSENNGRALTRIKTNINKFSELLKNKSKEDLDKSLSLINSSLSRAVKMGLIKKQFVSRKLSSLSKKIKNI